MGTPRPRTVTSTVIRFIFFLSVVIFTLSPLRSDAQTSVSLSLGVFQQEDGAKNRDTPSMLVGILTLSPHTGWHAYGPGELPTGQPTTVTFTLEPEKTELVSLYPEPELEPDLFDKDTVVPVYNDTTPIFVKLPAGLVPPFTLTANASMLMCSSTSCWPVHKTLRFTATQDTVFPKLADTGFSTLLASLQNNPPSVAPTPTTPDNIKTPTTPKQTDSTLPTENQFEPRYATPDFEVSSLLKALPLAFLAGLILNLMPCVLPVMSLKLTGLLSACSRNSAMERARILRQHNTMFSLGIIVYFIILSVIFGALGLAWGGLFQNQTVIIAASAIIFLLALSLFDIYHLPILSLRMTKTNETSPHGAFFTGILATLLATPCSGPFLGGVLAWTLLQPTVVIMAVFFTIGIGMAFPYLLLALRPEAMRFFPNPGPWMIHLERLVGFVLVATSLYFLAMLETRLVFPTLILLWLVAAAAYIWGKLTSLSQPPSRRLALRLVAVFIVVFGAVLLFRGEDEPSRWVDYTPATFTDRLCKENIVLDFTAEWCPTCKLLEKTVFTPDNIDTWSDRFDATFIKVDLTRNDEHTMKLLNSLGSQSIPLVALFPRETNCQTPMVLRDMFTSGQITSLMETTFQQE
ncbi:protein-disulfide reductase DsbD family protein [Desulfovibrio inopinatus]|uniref:protein-disulfide reductase DsbD family protein n=1 Tax=Desulfovibrio inopinatus TaxID=102109 RepID=UPI00146F95EC|nr:cytochrome c biogenesis protein CcdA [Desulfovibrio inopinatus]